MADKWDKYKVQNQESSGEPDKWDKYKVSESEETSLPEEPKKNFFEDVANQAVEGPGRDIASGLLKGNIAVMRPTASVASAMGLPDKFNLMQQSIAANEELLRNLPPSRSSKPAEFINEMVGMTPGVTAEFLQGKAVLAGAGVAGQLSKTITGKALIPPAELAVTRAMEELQNGFPEALEAAKEGSLIGMGFPVAIKGLQLLKSAAKPMAKKLIEMTTGNSRLAEDFVEHPFKYSLRFFDKNIKRIDDAKLANAEIKQKLVDTQKADLENFRGQQKRVKEDFLVKQKNSSDQVREIAKDTKEKLAREGQLRVDDIAESTKQKLQTQREALSQRLDSDVGNTIQVADKIRQHEGQIVGDAIEGIVAITPDAGIRVGNVKSIINQILKDGAKRGLYRYDGKSAIPVTSGQKMLATRINRVLGDIKALKTKTGNVPLEVLQGLKNDTRSIAERAYRTGDGNTGKIFSDLSKELNPANIVSKDPVLSRKMSTLAEANASFSKQIKPYNDLIALATKKDANGNMVTDMSGLVGAVRNNNVQVINRIRKIDAALPEADRLLPKLKRHVADVDKAVVEQKAALKLAKRNVSDAQNRVAKEQRELMRDLDLRQRSNLFKLNEEQRAASVQNTQRKANELRALNKSLDEEIIFLEDQDALRSFEGHGLTGLLQRIFSFGGILPVVFGRNDLTGASLASLGVVAGLSPAIQGRVVQSATRASQAARPFIQGMGRAGAPTLAQRITASESSDDIKSGMEGSTKLVGGILRDVGRVAKGFLNS